MVGVNGKGWGSNWECGRWSEWERVGHVGSVDGGIEWEGVGHIGSVDSGVNGKG